MKRAVILATAAAVLASAAGCGTSHAVVPPPDRHVSISMEAPPSPTTWPKYPHFSQHSCWARPFLGGELRTPEQVAPSYPPAPQVHPTSPADVAKQLLARFGDGRYVQSIEFSPAPPAVGSRIHVFYAGGHPPADALEAKIVVTGAEPPSGKHPSPDEVLRSNIAGWEGGLVGGALRDDLCSAGGAPLVYWTSPEGGGFAESGFALEQRFPNPSPDAFRKRVELVGKRFGFRIASLTLLHPEQYAPLLIVDTSRDRTSFVHDMSTIMRLLDPTTSAGSRTAQTFEGFFFAAQDANGPFADLEYLSRSEAEGGGWSWNPCVPPSIHSMPAGMCS